MGSLRKTTRGFRHRWVEPPLFRFLVCAGGVMPFFVSRAFSAVFAAMAGPWVSRRGTVMAKNLEMVAEPAGLEVKPSTVVRNMLNGFFDFLYLARVSDDRFRSLVEVRGGEHILEALSLGRGVLAITAHFSAWELIPRAVVLMGVPVGVVGRKLWNDSVSGILDGLRSRHGIHLLDRSASASGLIRLLRRNTAVGILIDQDTKKVESRFIPFLGLQARTPVGPSSIALRKSVPILTLHIAGNGKRRYLLTIDPVIDTGNMEAQKGIDELTGILNERIGGWIETDPNQWVWFHDRWNRRPSCLRVQ